MSTLSYERTARWSALAATLCAVHCATVPFLAVLVPVFAVSTAVEWWAFAATVLVGGGVTLFSSAWKNPSVALLLLVGAGVWALSLSGWLAPVPEELASPIGGVLFAGGMLLSARVCRSGECDRCSVDSATTTTCETDRRLAS